MKKLLLFIAILVSIASMAQSTWTPVSGKSRDTNGRAFGCKDSSAFTFGADTVFMYASCTDSGMYVKFKGYYRKLAYEAPGGGYVKVIDTSAMLSGYARLQIFLDSITAVRTRINGTGVLFTAAQPNITSVGTLTSLTVAGNITTGSLSSAGNTTINGNGYVAGTFGVAGLTALSSGLTVGTTIAQGSFSSAIAKANGSGVLIAAVAGIDYATPSSVVAGDVFTQSGLIIFPSTSNSRLLITQSSANPTAAFTNSGSNGGVSGTASSGTGVSGSSSSGYAGFFQSSIGDGIVTRGGTGRVGLYNLSNTTGLPTAIIAENGNITTVGTVNSSNLSVTGAGSMYTLSLPNTSGSTIGILYKGNVPYLSNTYGKAGGNLFLGASSGNFTMTGPAVDDGSYNIGVGDSALSFNSSGYLNTGIGYHALASNTTGDANGALGGNALYKNQRGEHNVAIGYGSLFNTNGLAPSAASGNVALGVFSAFFSTTHTNCTYLGYQAGSDVSAKFDANNSTAIGSYAYFTKSNQMVYGDGNITEHYFRAGHLGVRTNSGAATGANFIGGVAIGTDNDPGVNALRVTGTISGQSTLSITGSISTGGQLSFPAASSQTAGSVSRNATYGLTNFGVAGSTYSYGQINEFGNEVFAVPVGTIDLKISGQTTIAKTLSVTGSTTLSNVTTSGNLTVTGTIMINSSASIGGLVTMQAGVKYAYRAVTSIATITTADYTVNATSGTFTITLPTASAIQGQVFIIKNSGSGIITLATTGVQTIDGLATQTIPQYMSYTVMSDGANWIII